MQCLSTVIIIIIIIIAVIFYFYFILFLFDLALLVNDERARISGAYYRKSLSFSLSANHNISIDSRCQYSRNLILFYPINKYKYNFRTNSLKIRLIVLIKQNIHILTITEVNLWAIKKYLKINRALEKRLHRNEMNLS